jgi:ABC-type transporter Mla MlaB component
MNMLAILGWFERRAMYLPTIQKGMRAFKAASEAATAALKSPGDTLRLSKSSFSRTDSSCLSCHVAFNVIACSLSAVLRLPAAGVLLLVEFVDNIT